MPHIGSSHNIRLVVCSLQIGQWSQVAAVLLPSKRGEEANRDWADTCARATQRPAEKDKSRTAQKEAWPTGAPLEFGTILGRISETKTKCFQLEETNTNVGKRDACIRLCGSFRSDGEGRAYTYYTYEWQTRSVCVCVRGDFPKVIVTWLILPVVICLSQRLSHACLSINNFVLWNCEWLIKSVIVYLMVFATWITVVILELIHAFKPRLLEGVYLLDKNQLCWWIIITSRIAWPRAGGASFKYLPYQLSMVG